MFFNDALKGVMALELEANWSGGTEQWMAIQSPPGELQCPQEYAAVHLCLDLQSFSLSCRSTISLFATPPWKVLAVTPATSMMNDEKSILTW